MKSLFEILNNEKKLNNQCKSERSLIIKEFVDEINKERIETKFKKVTGKQIAIKLSHLNLASLYTFLSLAKDYKNRKQSFGKYFYGALKIR